MREEFILELQLLLPEEVRFRLHAMAFNRVAESPRKRTILDLSFDQIVLRAFLHRLVGQGLIVESCQHNQRNARGCCLRPPDGIEAVSIWQSHIQQDDVNSAPRKISESVAHALDMRDYDTPRRFFRKHLAKQTGVSGAVFNQENLQRSS